VTKDKEKKMTHDYCGHTPTTKIRDRGVNFGTGHSSGII
jgi:hypothetical protein